MNLSGGLSRREILRSARAGIVAVPTLTTRDTVQALQGAALLARDAGAKFDGRTDDTAELQRAIDAAALAGRPLVLPAGVARISKPLDLKGRYVALIGDPAGGSVLQAATPLERMIDVDEVRDVIDSPLFLYGLTLDGANLAKTGLRLRYRHRSVLDTVAVNRCDVGVDELDSWLGRRINCRTRTNATGWRLRGSNHSSVWVGCSFTDSRLAHLDIGVDGTAKDGNDALLFQGCDVEYGDGHGLVLSAGATATFDTCYLGENIGGDVIRSAGTVLMRGGVLFAGHNADRCGVALTGGTVTVSAVSVRGQGGGAIDRLVGASGGGRATFERVDTHMKLGGDQILSGDPLGTMPMRVFAPILGRSWQATAHNAAIVETSAADERSVLCRAVTGPRSLIGLAAPLQETEHARRAGAGYVAIAYAANRPVTLRVTSGVMSRDPWFAIGTLPPTKGVATYLKVDVPIAYAKYSTVELIMDAIAGDRLTLHHASLSDSNMVEPGALANVARAR